MAGWLPRCAHVAASARSQVPFVSSDPNSLSARCVRELETTCCACCGIERGALKV